MTNLVLWAGHFGIGLAYYLRFYLFKTKAEWDKEIAESEAKMEYSSSQSDFAKRLAENKLFVLVLYLFCGYVNLFIHAKRVYTKLKEKRTK